MKKYIILLGAILAVLTYNYYTGTKADPMQPEIAEKIIRFHVRANSDMEEDQKVKLLVRDAIGELMEPLLAKSESVQNTREIVKENMNEIVEVADQVLQENGMDYRATARLTMTDFPEKTYGDYTFPKGEYEALQVNLGEGEGHNWWCVLYPNMCFRGSVYQIVNEESERELREILTPEEYNYVFTKGKVSVKWKFLEYFGITM